MELVVQLSLSIPRAEAKREIAGLVKLLKMFAK